MKKVFISLMVAIFAISANAQSYNVGLRHRLPTISAIRRLLTEIVMEIPSVLRHHQQITLVTQRLLIVTDMEILQVRTGRVQITLGIPILLTRILMATLEVLQQPLLITLAIQQRLIEIGMVIRKEHRLLQRIILAIAIPSSEAIIAIRQSGVGKYI